MVKKTESSCSLKKKMNKGAWTPEEDQKLANYVKTHGEKQWRSLPAKAGLDRCGKSCRLRWLNYLRPGIKRGNISEDEEDLIIRLHNLIGNRWSLIAGRLPGRTDNEIKNHWNTHLSKKSLTINQLNWKLNQSHPINGDQCPTQPTTDGSDLAATCDSKCGRIEILSHRDASNCSDDHHLVRMKGSHDDEEDDDGFFDVDGLFDFSSLVSHDWPESDPQQPGAQCDDFKCRRVCEDIIISSGLQGSDGPLYEQQLTYNNLGLDFDTLTKLLEYEDNVFFGSLSHV